MNLETILGHLSQVGIFPVRSTARPLRDEEIISPVRIVEFFFEHNIRLSCYSHSDGFTSQVDGHTFYSARETAAFIIGLYSLEGASLFAEKDAEIAELNASLDELSIELEYVSEKVQKLENQVDLIRDLTWKDDLSSLKDTIQEAIDYLPAIEVDACHTCLSKSLGWIEKLESDLEYLEP